MSVSRCWLASILESQKREGCIGKAGQTFVAEILVNDRRFLGMDVVENGKLG
jgi:hypothetical protein